MINKVAAQLVALVWVVYISLSFAEQPVEIRLIKDIIENDLAGFNLYQNDDKTPIAVLDAYVKPYIWVGGATTINEQVNFSATAFDNAGNESVKILLEVLDTPPSPPSGVVKILENIVIEDN